MPTPPPTRRPEIPALTSLRFFAAFWVVLFHLREVGLWRGHTRIYQSTASIGYAGVSFFFVLSGFILVYVYSGRPLDKRHFWQARFARIYPAYLLSLVFTLPAVIYFLPPLRHLHLLPLVLTTYPLLLEAWFPQIFVYWNVVAWSLSAEAFFYLLFPFALSLLEKLTSLHLWIVLSILLSLVFPSLYVLLKPDGVAHTTSADIYLFWLGVIKTNPIVRLPEFLLGMGTGALFLRTPPRARTWPANVLIAAGLLALVLAIAFESRVPFPLMHSGLLAPAFALIVFGFATQPAWTRFLAAKPLILLGEASYSLYLLHIVPMAGMVLLLHLDKSPYVGAIVLAYLAIIITVSIAVYLFFEKPMRRLLSPRRAPTQQALSAA